jgi:hypothetical protein
VFEKFMGLGTLKGELILALCQLSPDPDGRRVLKENLDSWNFSQLRT